MLTGARIENVDLSVGDPGAGFVAHPRLCRILVGQWTDIRIPHNHPRTSIPSQNGVVVSWRSKSDGVLIVCHRLSKGMICRCARSNAALTNPSMPHTLPDDPRVVILFVVALDSNENLLRCFDR